MAGLTVFELHVKKDGKEKIQKKTKNPGIMDSTMDRAPLITIQGKLGSTTGGVHVSTRSGSGFPKGCSP